MGRTGSLQASAQTGVRLLWRGRRGSQLCHRLESCNKKDGKYFLRAYRLQADAPRNLDFKGD